MQSYVVLRHRTDLRFFRPDLFHTDIVNSKRKGTADRSLLPSSRLVEYPQLLITPPSPKFWQYKRLRAYRNKRKKQAQQIQQIQAAREWTIDIMADPAKFLQGSLCHSLDCRMGSGLILSVMSWGDIAELLRYLPNLRFFGLRSYLVHPGLFNILEELCDRVPDPNSDGEQHAGKRTTIDRPHRQKLERLELSFDVHHGPWLNSDTYYHPPFMRVRPGYSLGIAHLSLDMGKVPTESTALLLSQCRPGTLRSLRISGPCNLARGSLSGALAAHGPSLTLLTLGAGRPEWTWNKWLEWSISSALATWDITAFLKKRPMDALARLEIEGGPKYDGRFLQSPVEADVKEEDNRSQLWDEIKLVCDGLGINLVAVPLLPPIDGPY